MPSAPRPVATVTREAARSRTPADPADATSSLAFVVAGGWILAADRRAGRRAGRAPRRTALGALTVLIGVGSVVQHGPAPAWNPVVHDPPLFGALALVAADAVGDLRSRPVRARWWLAPTLAEVVLSAAAPGAAAAAQVAAAGVAVPATLLRARARPTVRRRLLAAAAMLAVGATVDRLARSGGPPHTPGGPAVVGLPGHAVWHVLAASALVVLAPATGRPVRPAPPPARGTTPRPGPAAPRAGRRPA
jgi:hypothetical protein